MVSATPSLETWLRVRRFLSSSSVLDAPCLVPSSSCSSVCSLRSFKLVEIHGNQPINARIVKRKGWLSEELKYAVYDVLDKGQQALLFFNRRGFASSVMCRGCRAIVHCDYCSTKVIYHRNNLTHCSYCGHKKALGSCIDCGAREWDFHGIGIERIEKEAQVVFPKARILVLSSETQDLPEKLALIHNNEVDLIIATQILAKGHNFKNLTLVGIIQGDQGANAGDPRATERIYQLLAQVRGRCGRGGIASRVVIQSNDVESELLKAVVKNDFDKWSEKELELRKAQKLPPYYKLIRIIVSARDPAKSREDAEVLYREISKRMGEVDWHKKSGSEVVQRDLERNSGELVQRLEGVNEEQRVANKKKENKGID